MRFACEQCQTKYSIPDDRVRGKILKIRCKNCSSLISVSEGGARTEQPPAPTPEQDSDGGDSTMIGGMADFFAKPAAAADADDWHLSVDGSQDGPMALSNLAQRILAQAGTSAELFVWRDGMDGWQPAEQLPEVKAAIDKVRSSPAAKPALASPAPAPADSDGGDATQIGSLNLPLDLAGKPADDDDVQDASMLSLEPFEAIEALRKASGPGKPAAPLPPKAPPPKAPPPFRAPPTPAMPPPPAAAAPRPGAPALPAKPAAPMFKTLPHPGLRPPGGGPAASPFAAALPSPAATPAPAPAPAPSESAAPSSSSPTGALASASSFAAVNQPSSEPSVMAALQFSPPSLSPPADSDGSAERPAKSKKPLFAAAGLVVVLIAVALFLVLGRPGSGDGAGKDGGAATADAGDGSDGGARAKAGGAQPNGKGSPGSSSKGGLEGISDSDFQALLGTGKEALDKCFSKAIQKDSKLSGTQLKVEIEVTAKGKASEVVLDGTGDDSKLQKCAEKTLKKWKFPKGPDKKPYKARFILMIKA
jgi:predicted Zn finger-like uncharacterized protein